MQGLYCDHLWKNANGRMLLRDVTLHLLPGQTLALLGPSGCGKTTLLKLLCGDEAPTAGDVRLDGKTPPTGYVRLLRPSDVRCSRTVEKNLLSALDARVLGADLTAQRLNMLLHAFQLAALRDRKTDTLSSGQRAQLVAACAIARRPRVLLLDSPRYLPLLLPGIRAVQKESQLMVLFATTDAGLALRHADQVALLDDGRILQVGAPEEVYLHPASVPAAQLTGPCCLLRGVVEGIHKDGKMAALDVDGITLDCPLQDETAEVGDTMVLCIRREHLHAAKSPLPFGQNVCGKVQSICCRFGVEEISAQLPGGQTLTALRHTEKPLRLDEGERVFLCWDKEKARLFADTVLL